MHAPLSRFRGPFDEKKKKKEKTGKERGKKQRERRDGKLDEPNLFCSEESQLGVFFFFFFLLGATTWP